MRAIVLGPSIGSQMFSLFLACSMNRNFKLTIATKIAIIQQHSIYEMAMEEVM